MADQKTCPDGGTCHHHCWRMCFRVLTCEPLSGVYPDDQWPAEVAAEHQPRHCFAILPGQSHPERGYVPSLVVEGEAGHTPMLGQGELSQPWFWGTDHDEAKRICAKANQETFGLTETEAADIVASSIGAQIAGDSLAEQHRVKLARALGRNPYAS